MAIITVSIAVEHASEIAAAIERAASAIAAGARLIEWRIDSLAEEAEGAAAAIELVRQSPAPCIVTCRLASEGGSYSGDEQTRISLFEALATAEPGPHPRYLDVELAAYQRSANLRQKVNLAVQHERQVRDLSTSLILSSHDFRGRPADLLQRVEAMTNEPACAVVKVAWQARSLRDNLEAFDLLRERRKPTIALCMGQFGLMSRVLAGKFGGLLTYAGDREATVTAPGQPTIEDLIKRYRFNTISAGTRMYGVIGWPVEHSWSPAIHNAGFEAVKFDGVYLPLPIPPEYEHFKATVGAMIDHPHLDFRGASVTIPHKENLLRFVRERGGRVDALSERIGASNTLVVGSAGGLECVNTDCPAAITALCNGMGIQPEESAGKRAAVLGAGGVARAVIVGLLDHGASVVVFGRDRAKPQAMIDDLALRLTEAQKARLVIGKPDELACGCFHIFINCTPIGMAGGESADQSPLEVFGGGVDVPLNDDVAVFDTVYTPARTPLIAEAQSRGAIAIPGTDMFIRQAALQFERWTSQHAPLAVLESVIGESKPRMNTDEHG